MTLKTENKAFEPNKKSPVKPYTLGEEIFNSVSHGAGSLLAIAAIFTQCLVFTMLLQICA